jgi:hypothetical protein
LSAAGDRAFVQTREIVRFEVFVGLFDLVQGLGER